MFHAMGTIFLFPFFVENTELHVGPRPKNKYIVGNTAWQDPEEKRKNFNRFYQKIWYVWFGRGTQKSWKITTIFKKIYNEYQKIKKFVDKLS
jgi:hypothetical protein